MHNAKEVLEELCGDILVDGILASELKGDFHHVQAEHAHPACAITLLQCAAGWQRCAAVEDSDVVEAEKSSLEDVVVIRVLAVHPPGEVQHELVEEGFQESEVALSPLLLLHFINPPSRPGEDRGIHVAEVPLVGGNLPVRMLIPLAC